MYFHSLYVHFIVHHLDKSSFSSSEFDVERIIRVEVDPLQSAHPPVAIESIDVFDIVIIQREVEAV